jgi:glycosyltransferase involved in cell wall biosynthesis
VPSILLLSRYDRLGASSRLRLFAYAPALRAAGFTVTEAPLLGDDYLRGLYAGRRPDVLSLAAAYARRAADLLAARRHDLVWVEKEALPWLPAGLERLLAGAVPTVMDIDDAWFHRYGLHRSAAVRRLLGGKLEDIARHARLVVAGSPHLADWARAAGARAVLMLPTVIDLDRYPAAAPPPPVPAARPFTVGWMGTPATRPYLDLAAGALRRLGGAVRLEVVGAEGVEIPGVDVTCRPWREAEEAAVLAGFDAGIMPLPDGPWERGKCGYKLIQYMAAGRPVVASPVGVNSDIVADGVNGFLAADEDGWVAALSRLAADPGRCAAMGAAGRRTVEERYCLQVTAPRLVAALAGA